MHEIVELLTIKQLSTKLNLSERTIARKVRERSIPFIKLPALRFHPQRVDAWLEKKEVKPIK